MDNRADRKSMPVGLLLGSFEPEQSEQTVAKSDRYLTR
jgi:hypothetical protein